MRRPLSRASLAIAALAVTLLACGDDDKPVARDSVGVSVPVSTDSAVPAPVGLAWDPAVAGPALFVPGGDAGAVMVVFPQFTDSTVSDSTAIAAAPPLGATTVELFSRAGRVGEAQVGAPDGRAPRDDGGCIAWPGARLTSGASPTGWLVGFARGHAAAMPLDSIEHLARADSSRMAADAARLASQIPNDTAVAFSGLPFVVRTAYRFQPAPGVEAIVADVVRRIAQEANPREQHVLLVAERPAGQPGARWRLAYHARASGPEDVVETREVLAAVTLGAARTPALLLGLTYYEGSAYTLLERTDDGAWRERWSSAYAGC